MLVDKVLVGPIFVGSMFALACLVIAPTPLVELSSIYCASFGILIKCGGVKGWGERVGLDSDVG